jgi:hypothetical protein
MLKRLLLALLLAAGLVSMAGCRLFHRDCDEYDSRRYPDCR